MKAGDRVEITKADDPYFQVGDKATLVRRDGKNDWWADFDEREWSTSDREFCIQDGFAECKVIDTTKAAD